MDVGQQQCGPVHDTSPTGTKMSFTLTRGPYYPEAILTRQVLYMAEDLIHVHNAHEDWLVKLPMVPPGP